MPVSRRFPRLQDRPTSGSRCNGAELEVAVALHMVSTSLAAIGRRVADTASEPLHLFWARVLIAQNRC